MVGDDLQEAKLVLLESSLNAASTQPRLFHQRLLATSFVRRRSTPPAMQHLSIRLEP